MKKIYHPYWQWEDYQNGMYDLTRKYTEAKEMNLAILAKDLLSDQIKFAQIAYKVITEWKNASEVNLSNIGRNRQAWIGQASCCYAYKIPERITKMGWRMMLPSKQQEANLTADKIIKLWEEDYAKNIFNQKCLRSFL